VRAWWGRDGQYPGANIGIASGRAHDGAGVVVLDVDPEHDGEASLHALEEHYGQLPTTLMCWTGGGGSHLYFAHPGDVPLGNVTDLGGLPGLDVKVDGGYVVAPPSLHRSRHLYEWTTPAGSLAPLASLPAWLRTLIERPPAPVPPAPPRGSWPDSEQDTPDARGRAWVWLQRYGAAASVGRRNVMGARLAMQLRDDGLTQAEAEPFLRAYQRQVPQSDRDPYSEGEALRTLASIYGKPAREPARFARAGWNGGAAARARPEEHLRPRDLDAGAGLPRRDGQAPPTEPPRGTEAGGTATRPLTEMGNAERLLDRHGMDIRYSPALGWITWDGTRWVPDSELRVREWAKETVRSIYQEGAQLAEAARLTEDQTERDRLGAAAEALIAWARKSERDRMIAAMVNLARSACVVELGLFDHDPWLLNVRNGTIDLQTGQLRPHRREDYLTQHCPVDYGPQAQAPTFERFLDEIMLGRAELVDYLQRALGYALTGRTEEQVWHLLVGRGANGKTTLVELIADVLGDYAGTLEPESVVIGAHPRDGGAPSPDIAGLRGLRFVAVTETEEGARIAAARVKKLAGGDKLTGRFLHRDPFRFTPCLKLWLYTNHKPRAGETTHGFWRKVRYLSFDYQPPEQDPTLPDRLRAELSGVLRWLVDGCLWWQRVGLAPPPAVLEATAAYRDEQDAIGQFLADRTIAQPHASVSFAALYAAYEEWCKEGGERPMGPRRFSSKVAERPGITARRTNQGRVWEGIGLAAQEGGWP
jgi:putative DNA primase/helicase